MLEDAPKTEDLDEVLVAKFQQGDEKAFVELMGRNKEKAVKLAYAMVGNYEDAKDIAQDSFVKAYKSLKKFEMKAKFSTWFYRVLMNTSKDHFRKKKWQKMMSWQNEEEMSHFMDNLEARGASADQGALSVELKEQMRKVILTLPEKQRWIFTLRFIECMSMKEIAQTTNVSEGAVKASLHIATQKFKKEMAGYVKRE